MCKVFKAEEVFESLDEQTALERGFRSRIKLNTDGVSVHLANLTPGVQNAHKHDTLYEMIMLMEGAVIALSWDDSERIHAFSLNSQGDTVIFHPGQVHTLVVERDSQVVVVRFARTDSNPDERTPLSLPLPLADARNAFADDPQSVIDAIKKLASAEE